jgi:hypothetical protein
MTKLWLDDAHITGCETAQTWKTVSLVETLVGFSAAFNAVNLASKLKSDLRSE